MLIRSHTMHLPRFAADLYDGFMRCVLSATERIARTRAERIFSLSLSLSLSLCRAHKDMRNHKESQLQLNKVKAGARAPTRPAQWQIRRAIIFYIRLASFQLTPAYGRQRLRGYRHRRRRRRRRRRSHAGRVQFPTLLLF